MESGRETALPVRRTPLDSRRRLRADRPALAGVVGVEPAILPRVRRVRRCHAAAVGQSCRARRIRDRRRHVGIARDTCERQSADARPVGMRPHLVTLVRVLRLIAPRGHIPPRLAAAMMEAELGATVTGQSNRSREHGTSERRGSRRSYQSQLLHGGGPPLKRSRSRAMRRQPRYHEHPDSCRALIHS